MEQGGGGYIDRALAFIGDSKWKAFFSLGAVIVLGIGWVLYEKRDMLFEAWLTPSAPELKTAMIPEALDKLTSETNADIVQIWAVDLSANSQWFLGARLHSGERPVIPSPRRLPIIVASSDVKALLDVLEGTPTCKDLESNGSPLARRLEARGMKRGCAIPIPPGPQAFVGVIYIAWLAPTDASNENVAVGAAREIATKLATH